MFTHDLAKRISGRFFSKTPVILQTEAAECGLACLAMVAGRYGHQMDLPAIRRRFTASIKGTTLKDLVRVGGELQLATRALRLDLDDLDKLRLPCILHWSHNHFVVLTRVQKNRITIIDPATGRRLVARAEVSKQFTGVALEAWPTEQFEEKNERIRIRVTDLIRRTRGIGIAALQIVAISLLLELSTIAMPIGFQLVLDEVVVAADYDLLTLIVIAMALMLVLQVATAFARGFQTMVIGSRLILQWKVSLFDHLMRLPLGFFEKRHVGDVVSRFGSLDTVQRTLTTSAIQSFLDGLMSVFLIFMMWLYGGWLLIIALVSTALYTIIRAAIYAHYRSISEEAIIHTAQESSHFMESVRGIGSLKVLNLESRRRGTWINHLVERVNAELRVQKFDAWFSAVGSLLFGADRILIIFLGVRAILGGDISVGMFVAFLAYKDQFATRVNGFVNTILQFRMLSLHGERVADIALADPEETDRRSMPAGASDASDRRPSSLVVTDVSFRYADNEANVLKGISLSVSAGECIGIAGPSGSGKTTLLKLLAGLALPTTGQVLIDGIPLSSLGLAAYRNRVGCVLQEDRLFAGSIFENITAFDSSADPAWVETCAQMAAIHSEIVAMPMGYDTLVGDMGSALSGGQKQRIILARAIYRRPSLLLLDEATSNLDHVNEQAINAAVRLLPITRIIIAHRESTLAMTDRVLCFDGAGELSEQRRSLTTNGTLVGRLSSSGVIDQT